MTAINGRVARLERAHGAHRAPEDEGAVLLRRFEGVVHLIPTAVLRLLLGAAQSPEQQAARRQVGYVLETGAWPT